MARIVGVRAAPSSPQWDGGRLYFADAVSLALALGDWVVVEPLARDAAADEPWVGEVVVAPEQVVEAAPLGPLARVARPADAGERPPARTEGAGLRLVSSLHLPDWATRSRSAAAPEHEGREQQRGGE